MFAKRVTKCTFEDFQKTFQQLREIGKEDLKTRVEAVAELQKTMTKLRQTDGMRSNLFFDKQEHNKSARNRHEPKERLSLPKIIPQIQGLLTGYPECVDGKQIHAREKDFEHETGKTRKQKRHLRTKDRLPICINCQMEALKEKPWLPELQKKRDTEKRSSKGEESRYATIALPEIRLSKYN